MAKPRKPYYPKAAASSGILGYQWDGTSNHMRVGVTERPTEFGPGHGYGITFGGFASVRTFLNQYIGSVRSMVQESYREGTQELGHTALTQTISRETLEAHAQPLGGYLVRTPDDNKVHAPMYFAFPFTDQERELLGDLKDTKERIGQIKWMSMHWTKGFGKNPYTAMQGAHEHVKLSYRDEPVAWSQFFHRHEPFCAFQTLAFLADRGRLWNDRT